ncbi:MAG: homing endonuclease associated repeat-containing protein [Methanobacterium sp.]
MSKKYTEEFLISEFWRFYNENGRYPFSKEMKGSKGYPSTDAFTRRWGSWNDFLVSQGLLGDLGWYKCDEEILKENYEIGKKEDLINQLMVKRKWEAIKEKASTMGLKRNFSIVRRVYSDEFLLNELKRFFNEFGRSPVNEDFSSNPNYPSPKVYWKRFGKWNEALKLAGLPINTYMTHSKEMVMQEVMDFYNINNRSPYYNELPFCHSLTKNYWPTWNQMLKECGLPMTIDDCMLNTREDGIKFLIDLKIKLGRVPYGSDLKDMTSLNRAWFAYKFGSWSNALLEAGLLTENDLLSREEMIDNSIDYLKELFKILERVPTVNEYDNYISNQSKKAFTRRNLCSNLDMTYLELCDEHLEYDVLDEKSKLLVNKLGKICRSVDEVNISNIFIFNNIDYTYEPPYKDVIKTELFCRYKFDWSINLNGKNVYIEYFGLYYPENETEFHTNYADKTHRKIKLCQENNVDLIDLYPDDLKNCYAGLVSKFKAYGINLEINEDLRLIS